MANNMASLLSQPSQATPPDAAPGQSQQLQGQQSASLQNLMQDNPGAGMAAGADGQPAPNMQMTLAGLRHMRMFAHEWEDLLKTDDIGKADIKGPFVKTMATLMGEQLVTLPQTLQMMKTFPEDPLGQRQWVQEHYARDRQAQVMLMAQHSKAFPGYDLNEPGLQKGTNHIGMMTDLVKHYKQFGKKKNA